MRYVIFRKESDDRDGWALLSETNTIGDAVKERESQLRVHGGTVDIFERVDILEAYAQAAAAQRQGTPLTRANYEIEPSRPAVTSTPPVGAATGNSTPDPSYDYEGEAARLIAKGHRVIDVPRPAPTKSYEAREVTATGGDA